MKMPEPVAWMDRDGDMYKALPTPYWHPPHQPLFTEAQLREALAQQAEEMEQLQEQNTALDAKLAQQEAVMRKALDALLDRDEYRKGEVQYAAIKALEAVQKASPPAEVQEPSNNSTELEVNHETA